MSQIRTFLGLNFPLPITRRIVDEVKSIAPEVASRGWKVAWVPPANLHMTMKFFGMVEEAAIEGMFGRLKREMATRAPFDLELRGFGAFPNVAAAKVLWLGITPTEQLTALQKNIETWMEEIGFVREERPFHPHVTVGRVREAGSTPLEDLFTARSQAAIGTARSNELVIYESRMVKPNSEYVALGRLTIGEAQPPR